jgi:hypothetical protein
VEVSPYFYLYGKQAVEAYYLNTVETTLLHSVILDHVKLQVQKMQDKYHIRDPGELTTEQLRSFLDEDMWDFTKIVTNYAGIPALYGICLQKQILSQVHYPERLRLPSAARPYLYSVVGSWGPLMFPMIWRAFRMWWEWTIVINPDYLLSMNRYFHAKPDLWTPYFTG